MNLPKIQQAKGLKGKRVLLRLGLNVPVKGGRVLDDFRIRKALPTIEYLKKKGAKIVIISHIGRNPKESLMPVATHLNNMLNVKIGFIPDIENDTALEIVGGMPNGGVIVLENLRVFSGEKENNASFVKKLVSFGDIYVNDAFSVSHRKHASIVGIPKYLPSYSGLLFQSEIKHLEMALDPKRPFLFVLGGAKIATKMPLLRKFAGIADTVFVGGALANDIYKAKGYEVGRSLVDGSAREVKKLVGHNRVFVPEDVIILGKNGTETRPANEVRKSDMIVDAGPKTRSGFPEMVYSAKFILINGPLGNYEKGFDKATKKLLKVASEAPAKVIVGGGDTVALVTKMKLEEKFTFVSTGGGAMLDFLADGKLPGIDAMVKCKHT